MASQINRMQDMLTVHQSKPKVGVYLPKVVSPPNSEERHELPSSNAPHSTGGGFGRPEAEAQCLALIGDIIRHV